MPETMENHVAVLAFPFASHPSVLLHLVQKLATAAPHVTFSFFNTAVSNQKLFPKEKSHGYSNVKSYDIDDGLPEGYVFPANPLEPINFFIKATPDNFKKRLAQAAEETGLKISGLLADAFLGFSVEMADEMGIPCLAFWTAGPRSLSAHFYTDEINRAVASHGEAKNEDLNLAFLPGMSEIHVNDLPHELLTRDLDNPFAKMLYNMIPALSRAKAVVLNAFDGMDPIVANDLRSKLPMVVLNIGPLVLPSPQSSQIDDELSCLSWLNKQKKGSVVYISFGTMLSPPPQEILAITQAIEEKQVPYLWSFRDNNSKNPPVDGFSERTKSFGKIVSWAPQLEVLAHSSVGVFVTHCGWSSLIESVVCGVPMICRPFFGDQKLNRRVVEDVWRIGVGIQGGAFTKDGMINALDAVFSRETADKMRVKISALKESAMSAAAASGSSSENFRTVLAIVGSKQS